MLILALGAVVLGCVFLVVSFLTENTAWAWGCIGACGLAAVVLVVDTIRRGRASNTVPSADTDPDADAGHEISSGSARPIQMPGPVVAEAPTQVLNPVVAEPPRRGDAVVSDDREPDEEDVDAADALAVGGLTDEVVVVDEHPRFHLSSCTWLRDKHTLALPINEAVDLGFTGCSRCRPSTALAAKSRAR